MNFPQLDQERKRPYPWRAEVWPVLRGSLLPLWMLWATTALALGLVWRGTGFAAPLLDLADWLGAAVWLGALWLVPAWERLDLRQRAFGAAQFQLSNSVATAILIPAAYLLGLAWCGLLLAYPASTPLLIGRPIDTDPVNLTIPLLLLKAFPLAAAALLLLALGSLTLLRRLLGCHLGSAVWLLLGVGLHSPALAGSGAWELAFTPGELLRQLIDQVQSEDPLLADHMFGPLRAALQWLWLAALVLLRLASLLPPPRPFRLPPLALALLAASSAAVLRSSLRGQSWLADLTMLEPDSAAALCLTFTVVLLSVWAHLVASERGSAVRELTRNAWLLLPAGATLLLCSTAIVSSGNSSRTEIAACVAVVLLLLLAALALAALLVQRFGSGGQADATDALGLLRACMLPMVLALPWSASGPLLSSMTSAVPALLADRPALLAALAGILGLAGGVLLRLAKPRRYSAPRLKLSAQG